MMLRSWLAPKGLHIEPAQSGDAEALARLHALGFYRGWPVSDFLSYIADRDTPILVACDRKRKIAGFIMLRLLGDDTELMTIAVDPKFRGHGVGEALVRAAFADLMMTPARRMLLEVAADNPAAVALYKKLGFTQISERQGYYERADGNKATALVLARDLG